jgi:hypothetical protein
LQQQEETAQHIRFEVPFAHSFWAVLGFRLLAGQRAQQLHLLPLPGGVATEHYDGMLLLLATLEEEEWSRFPPRTATTATGVATLQRRRSSLAPHDAEIQPGRSPSMLPPV